MVWYLVNKKHRDNLAFTFISKPLLGSFKVAYRIDSMGENVVIPAGIDIAGKMSGELCVGMFRGPQ
jgi:hypothetical protein